MTAENDAPTYVAGVLSVEVAEDTAGDVPPTPLMVATDVADVDGDALTVALSDRSSNEGALFSTAPAISLDTDTSVIVLQGGALNANANGVWTAVVELSDGDGPTAETVTVGTATVNVTAVNDAPTYAAGVLSVEVAEDTAGTVPSPPLTVASDVSDVDGDALTVALSDRSSNEGALFSTVPDVSLDTDTSVIVLQGGALNANANGVWTAVVELSDGDATVPVGTATVNVTAVNDAPTYAAGVLSVEVAEDAASVPSAPLTVATDVSDIDNAIGDLTVALVGNSSNEGALFSTAPTVSLDTDISVIVLQGGALTANANGVWTATVELSDGEATVPVGTATVNVTAVNDAPTYAAATLSVEVAEDTASVPALMVATDVADVDGDALTVALVGNSSNEGELFSTAPTISLNTDTSVIVLQGGALNANANGVWTATVELSDGEATVPVGTATVNVTAVNDAPTYAAGVLSVEVAEDTAGDVPPTPLMVATDVADVDNLIGDLTVALVGNSSNEGALFSTVPDVSLDTDTSVIVLQGGALNANANGVWTAVVELSDGDATVPVGTATVNVTAVNDAPTYAAGVLSVEVAEDTASVPALMVATDVADVDGDALTVALSDRSSNEGALFSTVPDVSLDTDTSVIVLQGGALTANANGVWTAVVELSDGDGPTAETVTVGTATVNVTAVNDAPVATISETVSYVVNRGGTPTVMEPLTVATGVRDVDGDALTVSLSGAVATPADLFATLPSLSLSGEVGNQLIVLSDGLPNVDELGEWTTTVELDDGQGGLIVVETVTVTVVDIEGELPTYTLVSTSVQVEETDAPVPVPVMTVATGVNDPEGSVVMASLSVRSADESNLFSSVPTVGVSGGSITVHGATAQADANGVWMAVVWLDDVDNTVSVAEVTISVVAVNDVPTYVSAVGALSVEVAEDTAGAVPPAPLTVATDVSDVDGDALMVSLTNRSNNESELFSTPPDVSLDTDANVIVLQGGALNADANGEWTAVVQLIDGDIPAAATVTVGTVTVNVTAVNDSPSYTAATLSLTVAEDTAPIPVLTVATGVSDVDGDALDGGTI